MATSSQTQGDTRTKIELKSHEKQDKQLPNIWKNSRFLILFSSAFFVAFGAKIYDLALPLLVYELTQSAQMMGWMRAVEFLPNLLLALFIGVWVDRFNKKRWSQCMLLGQIVILVISFSAVRWLDNPLIALFPCAFLMMAFNYGYHNARMGMMKNALPQSLQNTATARMSSLYSLLETIGPVLSGALLLMSALHNVFLLVCLFYLIAFFQLNRLQVTVSKTQVKTSIWASLKEGFIILYRNKNMWYITLAVMVINTTGAIFWIQAIYFAKATLALSHLEIGYLVAASGIGGLIGAFSADKVRKHMGIGLLLIVSIFLESIGFIIPLIYTNTWTLLFAFFWISAVGLYGNICIWSYRQEAFDEDQLGRVTGITGSLFKLLMPAGLASSGYLVAAYGIDTIFILCFIIQALTAGVLFLTRVSYLE